MAIRPVAAFSAISCKDGSRKTIAFDLPGHGQSSSAPDPTQSYTRPGLADAAVELPKNSA